jgi:LysM repeat protein
MSEKESAQNVIDAYRKRQQAARRVPVIFGISALLLVVGGAVLIFWLTGSDGFSLSMFATETPTPTATFTPEPPTPTLTSTLTPTATATEVIPTEEPTATPATSFIYIVQPGDSIFAIHEKFDVDLLLLLMINNLSPANPIIQPDMELIIPGPDVQLPTPTQVPPNLPRGTKIEYMVQFGDSLGYIAGLFNSTVDAIKRDNKLANENDIYAGQTLIIQVNLVTPIPTATITNTPVPTTPLPVFNPRTSTPSPTP